MSRQQLDADTAETLAGVVRLLRRAAQLVWAAIDAEGAGSPRQVLGLGIDLAADEARNLLPDAIPVDGPVPVGDEPAGLLRSAEQLLRRVTTPGAGTGLHVLRAQVADLVGRRTQVTVTLSSAGVTAAASVGDVRTVAIPASHWHVPVLAGFRAVGAGTASQEVVAGIPAGFSRYRLMARDVFHSGRNGDVLSGH